MIQELSIQGFKSWLNTGAISLAPLTAFFGTNSSGKTSLLQFLLMLKQTVDSADRRQVLYLGDERSIVNLGTFREILTRTGLRTAPLELSWKLNWKLPAGDVLEVPKLPSPKIPWLSFGARLQEAEENRPIVVKEMMYGWNGLSFGMRENQKEKGKYDLFAKPKNAYQFKRVKRGRAWPLPHPMKCYGFPDEVRAYFKNAGFLSDFELAFERLFDRVFYLGPLREYPRRQYTWAGIDPLDMGKRGEFVVEAILASKERGEKYHFIKGRRLLDLEELIAAWLKELGLISSFKIRPVSRSKTNRIFQVWVKQSEASAEVLLTGVGFGISQILPVIALCYYVPKGSTVVLEQPEIHLHPAVQAGLAQVFAHAMEERSIQIILESHSEYLLKRLQLLLAKEEINRKDVSFYFCSIDRKDGLSKLSALAVDDYGNIKNWPEGFFGNPFKEMSERIKAERMRKKKVDTL